MGEPPGTGGVEGADDDAPAGAGDPGQFAEGGLRVGHELEDGHGHGDVHRRVPQGQVGHVAHEARPGLAGGGDGQHARVTVEGDHRSAFGFEDRSEPARAAAGVEHGHAARGIGRSSDRPGFDGERVAAPRLVEPAVVVPGGGHALGIASGCCWSPGDDKTLAHSAGWPLHADPADGVPSGLALQSRPTSWRVASW